MRIPSTGDALIVADQLVKISTMMHAMAGQETVDAGSIRTDGLELVGLSKRERTVLRRTRIGFVFQAFNLVPALTAAENIEFPLRLEAISHA